MKTKGSEKRRRDNDEGNFAINYYDFWAFLNFSSG
jgi:hypothetical protein